VDILNHWIEDQNGKVFSLQNPFSIGRSSDNTYVIASERVSRQHALVQARAEGEFWLTDLGSRNGVFLNRQPLQQTARLRTGDIFQIANSQFVFHSQELHEIASDEGTHTDMTMVDRQTVDSWILVADIVGSVGQAQTQSPNIWTGKVGAWIGQCRSVLEQNGGTMSKFLGDGFLSFWSTERSSAPEVVAALNEMLALQKKSELPFRFVIHYGPVQFVGISRGEISLTGNAVNFTFRLEKVAARLGKNAVASRAVADSFAGQLAWKNLGPQKVPGFEEASELFSP
jgi:adenylate cyclase